MSLTLRPHDPTIHILENGLEVLLRSDPTATITSLQVWVRTGSIHEESWLGAGLSHLLEHMLFNGTERRGPRQVSEEVQAAGAYINAYTSFDRTVYWIDTPPESAEACLDILGDMVLHSTLPEEEFRKELEVIRREMAMGDDSPGRVVSKLLFATAFREHPSRHPVIGHRQVFDQLTREDLVAFYRKHYVPNNMFLVAAGPFEEAALLGWVETAFGSVPRAPRAPVSPAAEPGQQGRRVVHQVGKSQNTHLRIAWHGPKLTSPDSISLSLAAEILGSGRSSRLWTKLREELQLVHSISVHLYSVGDATLFLVAAETDPDKREAAEEAILREIASLIGSGVTESERTKAINCQLSDVFAGLSTSSGVASDIASSWHLMGNANYNSEYLGWLQDVTVEDIRHRARQWLDPLHCTIVSLNPPDSPVRRGSARTSPQVEEPRRVVLPNGLTLLVKRDNRLPLVNLHSATRGGLLAEPEGASGLTRLVARLLTRDTESATAAEVAERIESVGGDLSHFAGYNSFGLSATVMAPHWELGLDAVAEGLTRPAFRAEALERERIVQLASIRSELDRPMTVASNLKRAALFRDHPYRHSLSGTPDSISAITRDHLSAYHRENVTAANTVLSVYGDIDPEAVIARASSLLGSLATGERRFGDAPAIPPLPEIVRVEQCHDKEQAIVLLGFQTAGLRHEDSLALHLLEDACSDMSSRFFNRIREDLGAAYSVGASLMSGFCGGSFTFYAATSPEKADEVEEALRAEVDFLAGNGLVAEEFERARKSWQGSHRNRLQSAAGQAGVHVLDELYDLGWDHCNRQPARMDAFTPEAIQDVARRYFHERNHVVVRYLPGKP